MTWNYRIVRHPQGWLALHEVYYGEDGQPNGYTENPASFGANEDEGPAGIIAALEMALRDARERPVFDPEASTPPQTPDADGKVLMTFWFPASLVERIKGLGDDFEARVERILQQGMDEATR